MIMSSMYTSIYVFISIDTTIYHRKGDLCHSVKYTYIYMFCSVDHKLVFVLFCFVFGFKSSLFSIFFLLFVLVCRFFIVLFDCIVEYNKRAVYKYYTHITNVLCVIFLLYYRIRIFIYGVEINFSADEQSLAQSSFFLF